MQKFRLETESDDCSIELILITPPIFPSAHNVDELNLFIDMSNSRKKNKRDEIARSDMFSEIIYFSHLKTGFIGILTHSLAIDLQVGKCYPKATVLHIQEKNIKN